MKLIHIWPLCTNTFLVLTDAGHAVAVDPAASVESYTKALAENNAQLTHIFLTHGHYDHVGAVEELVAQTGAVVYIDPADRQGSQMFPLKPQMDCQPWPQSGELRVDELTFRIWHTPGHSPGSVCIGCGGLLFSGDTLLAGSGGRVDLPGGSPAQMRQSLSLVAALPLSDDTQVLPGHQGFSTLGQERKSNPYLLGDWY